jgi:hypothetical protein
VYQTFKNLRNLISIREVITVGILNMNPYKLLGARTGTSDMSSSRAAVIGSIKLPQRTTKSTPKAQVSKIYGDSTEAMNKPATK